MADLIKSNRLPRLTGVPSVRLRDWRRHGYLPKDQYIDARWAQVAALTAAKVDAGYRLSYAVEAAMADVFLPIGKDGWPAG